MDTSSVDDGPADVPGRESEVVSKWIVRIFLILAFGLAFGIEGMTLIRSYLWYGDEPTEQREPEEEAREMLRVGDELLPALAVSAQVDQLRIRARTDGPWTFHLVVRVQNDTEALYRLTVGDLETDDGTEYEEAYSIECPPGDSTRLVASWPIGADARPASLEAEGELVYSSDSTRTAERDVHFGHVPVQMVR